MESNKDKNKKGKKKAIAGGSAATLGTIAAGIIGGLGSNNDNNQEVYTQTARQFSHSMDTEGEEIDASSLNPESSSTAIRTSTDGSEQIVSMHSGSESSMAFDETTDVNEDMSLGTEIESSEAVSTETSSNGIVSGETVVGSSSAIPSQDVTSTTSSGVDIVDTSRDSSYKVEGVEVSALSKAIQESREGPLPEEYIGNYGVNSETGKVELMANKYGGSTYGQLSSPGKLSDAATIVNANASNSNKLAIIPGGIYNKNGKYLGAAYGDVSNYGNVTNDNISTVVLGTQIVYVVA